MSVALSCLLRRGDSDACKSEGQGGGEGVLDHGGCPRWKGKPGLFQGRRSFWLRPWLESLRAPPLVWRAANNRVKGAGHVGLVGKAAVQSDLTERGARLPH